MTTPRKNTGFTLIELMIVIAIIGILATIAFPAYQNYVMRTKRSDAKVALLALQQAMEKYRANCPQYPTTIAATRSCSTGNYALAALNTPVTTTQDNLSTYPSPKGYYNIGIVNASATTYRIRAISAIGGEQIGDTLCGRIFIDTSTTPPQIALQYNGTVTTEDCWK